jgi:hypothetical protein
LGISSPGQAMGIQFTDLREQSMDSEKEQKHEWRPLRVRVIVCIALSIGFIPFGLAVKAYVSFGSNGIVQGWMICWALSTIALFRVRCPNCHRSFFVRQALGTLFVVRWPFTRHCLNCHIRIGSSLRGTN